MKRRLSLLLAIAMLLLATFNLCACSNSEPREASCEEIIEAYESAGYALCYHNHDDPIYYEFNEYCHIEIEDPDDPENNYIYITRYYTKEDAEAMEKERQFNPILWIFFGVSGEWRWLQNGNYGDVYYETFDSKMIKPLKSLMN